MTKLAEKVLGSVMRRWVSKDKHEKRVQPPAVEHTVQHVYREQVQPVHVDELRMLELKHVIQPVDLEPEEQPPDYDEQIVPVTFDEVLHKPSQATQEARKGAEERLGGAGMQQTLDDIRETTHLRPIKQVTTTHEVIEVVQPVFRRRTVIPHDVTKVVPSYSRHVHYVLPTDGEVTTLPPVTQTQWLASTKQP